MKRRLWAVLLILAMVLSLCACGGKKEEPKEETAKEETKKEEKEEKHQAGDIVGQWKCTSITMDELGTLDSDECKELLGYDMLATISFSGWDAGHCAFSLMEENEEGEQVTKELAMLWTKENDNYTLTFEDPEASASYSGAAAAFDGETLVLTMKSAAGDGDEEYRFEYAGEPKASIYSFAPEFTEEDVRKMSIFSNGGFDVIVDDMAYGYETHGKLACAKISKDGSDVVLKDVQALLDGEICQPGALQYEDGYVYAAVHGEKNLGIVKINVKDNKTEFLYDKYVEYMQIYDGKLYFTDENSHYCSMDLDGKNITPIIEDREVYYPYQLGDGWMVFQDDADGETLHIYHIGEKIEKKITEIRSYTPMISGEYLYFQTTEDSKHYYLGRVNLRTWETEISEYANNGKIFIDGDYLFAESTYYTLDEWNQELDQDLESCEYGYFYSDGNYRVYNTSFECWFSPGENFGGSSAQLWLDE